MFKRAFVVVGIVLVLVLMTPAALLADDAGEAPYPWRDHEAKYDFMFNNMIDNHQQTRLMDDGTLKGFIYIHYTGEYTEDGYPIARRADCTIEECTVGWVVQGIPVTATLLKKGPRIWLVNSEDLPKQPGYTHFHWISEPEVGPYKPSGLVVEQSYDGILMRRLAVASFFWLGGKEEGGGSGGGCGGHEPGGEGEEPGGCEDDGGCTDGGHEPGGCEDDGGCTDGGHVPGEGEEPGGCEDDGGCTDGGHDPGDDGGCSGGGHEPGGSGGSGGSGGHGGRLVLEGIDDQVNIVTDPADVPTHGGLGGGHGSGGCEDDGGCSDGGHEPGGCEDDGDCSDGGHEPGGCEDEGGCEH